MGPSEDHLSLKGGETKDKLAWRAAYNLVPSIGVEVTSPSLNRHPRATQRTSLPVGRGDVAFKKYPSCRLSWLAYSIDLIAASCFKILV